MKLRDRIEENIVVWFLGTVVVSFGGGFGAYQAFLESARMDVVSQGTYIKLELVTDQVIRWDPEIAQYVSDSTKDSYVKVIPQKDLPILSYLESENRRLLRYRFQQAKAQIIQSSRKDVVTEILKVSSEAFGQVRGKDLTSLLLKEGEVAIFKFRIKREELLRNVAQQEQQAMDRANQGFARLFPPGPVSAALLNLRESMRKVVRVNGEGIRDRVASFLEEKWVPIFLARFVDDTQEEFSDMLEGEGKEVAEEVSYWMTVVLNKSESKESELLEEVEIWEERSLKKVDYIFSSELLTSPNPDLSQASSMLARFHEEADKLNMSILSELERKIDKLRGK